MARQKKAAKIATINKVEQRPTTEHRPDYEPSELVIKEIMVQKGCTRDKAIEILKNPAKHPERGTNFAKS